MISHPDVPDTEEIQSRDPYGDHAPDPAVDHADDDDEEEALLADRSVEMALLVRRFLSAGRLGTLWGAGLAAVLGWAAVGLAVESFAGGGLAAVSGLVLLFLALIFLGAAVVTLGFWGAGSRRIRRDLDDWADAGSVPVTDVRLRAQRRCVLWLLPSAALSVAGAAVTALVVTRLDTVTVSHLVYAFGLGVTTLLTGLLGVFQAVAHQRWSGQLLTAVPLRTPGGAHR
ncbi:hypothetical protein QR77_24940 [Streptomyces sp. 150FB]|uniref:hypothetical protein n=1 Tax=Streptomyces sp. 150FB TaxID=1576605 RepID=UPI0005890310|nr:hypothetical protein [Streptomyces sp. 150FB]KIF76259.1 hypothetical protein QR77_24940 [Streptomyces sp. 150FB]